MFQANIARRNARSRSRTPQSGTRQDNLALQWRDQADLYRALAILLTKAVTPLKVPQQLFGRRRQLRESEAERFEAVGLNFVLAVLCAGLSPALFRIMPRCKAKASAGMIEAASTE